MPEATATISVPDLVAVLRRSALVEDERLKKALQGVDLQQVQAEDITQLLVDAKLLTQWQCKQLLKGRYKGYRLGKYLLLGELGRGGMAKVFLARHETLQSLVAIKVLARHRLAKPSMIQRFLREARAAAQLGHPNIVRVFDVDADEDRHYLVMEYIRGRSVQDMVDEDGPLPFDRAVRFAYEAALGLSAAHKHGLIHRDVKPANLLVEDDQMVKLSDFGLARAGGEEEEDSPSLTMQHDEKVLGTADYIAPEQAIHSHHIDARADQYSLGCTLYFMLTGQPPFPTGRIVERLTKHCTQEPPSISTFRPDVPPSLLAIVHKLTRKNPSERFDSADAAAAALAEWLANPANSGAPFVLAQGVWPRPSTAHSSTARFSAGSSVDEELSLAPDDDDEPSDSQNKAAAATSDAHKAPMSDSAIGKRLKPKQELPQLDDDAVIDERHDSNFGGFTETLGDVQSGDLASPSTSKAARPVAGRDSGIHARQSVAGGAGMSSDVHGSDVRGPVVGQSRIDTASSRALPTGGFKKKESPRPSALVRLQASMQRGEYPLWLLIASGIILGGVVIMVALSYVDFSKKIAPPEPAVIYKRQE